MNGIESLVRSMLSVTSAKRSPPMVLSVAANCVQAMVAAPLSYSVGGGSDRHPTAVLQREVLEQLEAMKPVDDVQVTVLAATVRQLIQHLRTALDEERIKAVPVGTTNTAATMQALERAWVAYACHVSIASPPFPLDVIAAVAHVSAALYTTVGIGEALYKLAVASLEVSGDGVELLLTNAAEVLTHLVAAITSSASSANLGVGEEAVVEACLLFLARPQTDASVTPLVTRRLLIPLMVFRRDMMDRYVPRIHALLETLHSRRLLPELIVTIAALFEFLFPSAAATVAASDPLRDFRRHPLLWVGMKDALHAALESSDDAGKRTTMQLQVTYLLKRIVALTATLPPPRTADGGLGFHALFPWHPQTSEQLWTQFFLIFETLNEYGVHINAPALAKLDELLSKASCATAGNSAHAFANGWIELLLTKAVLHPNVGVRKLLLRKLWRMSTEHVSLLSQRFVCRLALLCAADVRLCTELDRVVLPSTFLECKVFDGREDHTLPKVLPLAEQMQSFYCRYLNRCCHDEASQVSALRLMLGTVDIKTTRFTVAAIIRVLWFAIRNLERTFPASATLPGTSLLTAEVMSTLQTFVKDQIHDRHPFWLELRLNALMLDALLHLAAHCSLILGVPITTLAHIEGPFRRLLSLCSVCGETGGKAVATIDASVNIGCVGAALPSYAAAARIQALLVSHAAPVVVSFSKDLLRVGRVVADVSARLEEAASAPHYNELIMKEVVAYVSQVDDVEFATLWRTVVDGVASIGARTYVRVSQICSLCQCFTEVVRNETHLTPNATTSSRLLSATNADQLTAVFGSLCAYVERSLQTAAKALPTVTAVDQFSAETSPWEAVRTTHWDAVTAALSTCLSLALAMDLSLESFDVARIVRGLAMQLVSLAEHAKADVSGCAYFALIVLCRSAARALHGVVSAFAGGSGIQNIETRFGALMPVDARIALFRQLRGSCFRLHLGSSDTPTSLSSLSWGNITAQYFRALYNTLHVLCLATTPALTVTVPSTADDRIRVAAFVDEMQAFAMEQLDACSTSNLSSLYDIVSWSLMAQASEGGVVRSEGANAEMLVRSLLNRLDDTQRREYFRCAALAIYSLRYCSSDAFVTKTIMSMLKDESESERVVFFAASMVCTLVLADIQRWWPVYKDVVMHIAVMYNSGRDEEELEGCLAVTEPAFATWPVGIREITPPSVRLGAVARALAISVVLKVCSNDSATAMSVSMDLLASNWTNKDISHEPCMPSSNTHRCRVRIWQLMCSILPTLNPEEDWKGLIQLVMKKALPINNMGSVRRFMELYLVGAFLRNPKLYALLASALDDFTLRPQVCGSYAMVAVHVLVANEGGGSHAAPGQVLDTNAFREEVFQALFPRLVRLCGSNQHLLRIISHIGLHELVTLRRNTQRNGVCWQPTAEVDALFQFIDTSVESMKFREKHNDMVLFDSVAALAPRQLFCIQRKEASMWLKESIPAITFDRIRFLDRELSAVLGAITPFEYLRSEFLQTYFLDREVWQATQAAVDAVDAPSQRSCGSVSVADLADFALVPHAATATSSMDAYIDYTAEVMDAIGTDDIQVELEACAANGGGAGETLQRKVTSWWNSEVYNELHPRALGSNERQSLIVVGTLLENPVNIAGLCRCGEIFAVEKVVVPDKKVFEHPHFVATARSAELWMPWEEVHPMNLIAYLLRMRTEGYTILGVEQTSTSVSMASYVFPERVVMVLGSEGQGIPAEYLPFLDVCVEIPQYGLIRSLNVHVTGAVAMYEFTKQNLMTKNGAGAQLPATPGL